MKKMRLLSLQSLIALIIVLCLLFAVARPIVNNNIVELRKTLTDTTNELNTTKSELKKTIEDNAKSQEEIRLLKIDKARLTTQLDEATQDFPFESTKDLLKQLYRVNQLSTEVRAGPSTLLNNANIIREKQGQLETEQQNLMNVFQGQGIYIVKEGDSLDSIVSGIGKDASYRKEIRDFNWYIIGESPIFSGLPLILP